MLVISRLSGMALRGTILQKSMHAYTNSIAPPGQAAGLPEYNEDWEQQATAKAPVAYPSVAKS